jgi:hypothetical protein
MSPRSRPVRYGIPVAIVVAGLAWAAVDTGRVGNTAGTALIAIGLILLLTLVGRDLGMGEQSARRRAPVRPPGDPARPPGDPARPPGDPAPERRNGARPEPPQPAGRGGSPPSSPS